MRQDCNIHYYGLNVLYNLETAKYDANHTYYFAAYLEVKYSCEL